VATHAPEVQVDAHVRDQGQDRGHQVGLHRVVADVAGCRAEHVEVDRLVLVEVQRPGADRARASGR